jgi:hypothetical protein
LTCRGVGKSGSPAVRLTIVRPSARRSRARAVAIWLGDGLKRLIRGASVGADMGGTKFSDWTRRGRACYTSGRRSVKAFWTEVRCSASPYPNCYEA